MRDAFGEQDEHSPRLLLELIEWLPDTSALAAAQHGGKKFKGWGLDRQMTKALIDGVNVNTVITAKAAAGKKGKSIKLPKPWPSPLAESLMNKAKKPKLSLADFARRINRTTR